MTWRTFGKRVRRFTVLVILDLISGFALVVLTQTQYQGESLPGGVAWMFIAAIAATLWQSVRGLRMINSLLPEMDDIEADRGGMLIPYTEQGLASEGLPEVSY